MIRLIVLLLGGKALRARWWMFIALSGLSLMLSLVFIDDLFDTAIVVTTDVIGLWFVVEGLARLLMLAAIGFPNATIPVLKSLGFFALGFLAINVPWDDNIVAAVVLGAALVMDGVFRIAAAAVIRSVRWRQALVVAGLELGVAALVWAPWPVPYLHTVPFCIGVALLAATWSLCQLGLQLRGLRPGASVTDLPLFASSNWHGRGILHPAQAGAGSYDNDAPLTVHVWTPVGSAVHARRRPVIDRYIAAVDQGGVISTGHAALSLPPKTYVSFGPANDLDHSPTEFGRLLRAGPENDVPGRYKASLEQEIAEWRPPDHEVRFYRYNAAALRAFFERYRGIEVYNLTSRNCSSTVALSLDAAVEGALGQGSPWRTLLRLFTDPAMWLLVLWRARA